MKLTDKIEHYKKKYIDDKFKYQTFKSLLSRDIGNKVLRKFKVPDINHQTGQLKVYQKDIKRTHNGRLTIIHKKGSLKLRRAYSFDEIAKWYKFHISNVNHVHNFDNNVNDLRNLQAKYDRLNIKYNDLLKQSQSNAKIYQHIAHLFGTANTNELLSLAKDINIQKGPYQHNQH